jgi:transposase
MIVDLERRSVVDILEDRNVASAAQWLERHPSVEIVSRDRCGLYAQAVGQGAPQARQLADRFHLMNNLRIAIEEQISLSGRATGRALLPDEGIGSAQVDPHVEATHRRCVRHAHRQSRHMVFEMVHALHKEGRSCSEIARRTGYGRRSIAKWLTFDTPPDRHRAALKPTSPLHFEAFLTQCWKMAIAAADTCSTISNSGATRAASRISSDCSQAGVSPRGQARTMLRRLRSYALK